MEIFFSGLMLSLFSFVVFFQYEKRHNLIGHLSFCVGKRMTRATASVSGAMRLSSLPAWRQPAWPMWVSGLCSYNRASLYFLTLFLDSQPGPCEPMWVSGLCSYNRASLYFRTQLFLNKAGLYFRTVLFLNRASPYFLILFQNRASLYFRTQLFLNRASLYFWTLFL